MNCIVLTSIPHTKGLYIVKRPTNMEISFTNDTTAISYYKGKSMVYIVDELLNKYELSDKEILYIGKAGGEANRLRQRVRQFVNYGYGLVNNHRGGCTLWQIVDNKNLTLGFMECLNPEEIEKEFLREYLQINGVLPLVNWKIG